MTTQTRIYAVTINATTRLVRAAHPAQALMHVARDIAQVKVAGQDDLLGRQAADVEDVKASEGEAA